MAAQTRSPEQIKADLERHRTELATSIERLQGEVAKATDWRSAIARNQQKVLIGAAVAGFVIGGGIAGVTGIFRRR
jgi:hypothetical protein